VIVAGRLMSVREIKEKLVLPNYRIVKGRIQLYLNRDVLCPEDDKTMYNQVFKKLTDLGDFIGIEELFTTKVEHNVFALMYFTFE
jgi:lysyl-tRNA synthetase class 2